MTKDATITRNGKTHCVVASADAVKTLRLLRDIYPGDSWDIVNAEALGIGQGAKNAT